MKKGEIQFKPYLASLHLKRDVRATMLREKRKKESIYTRQLVAYMQYTSVLFYDTSRNNVQLPTARSTRTDDQKAAFNSKKIVKK